MFRSIVVASLLVSAAVSLELHIKTVKCESRPVAVAFDYICNGDYLCAFGEPQSMEGYFTYYGLVDQFAATSDDTLTLDANFVYTMTGYSHKVNIVENLEMPLCHSSLQASQNNADGDCPADGKFIFNTVYDMPVVTSQYVSWAATGWSGDVVVDIYLNRTSDLVGRCKMGVTTMVSGAYENGAFRTVPSAKTVAYSVLGSLLGVVALCILCTCCVGNRRARQQPLMDDVPPTGDPSIKEPTSDYSRIMKIPKDQTYML